MFVEQDIRFIVLPSALLYICLCKCIPFSLGISMERSPHQWWNKNSDVVFGPQNATVAVLRCCRSNPWSYIGRGDGNTQEISSREFGDGTPVPRFEYSNFKFSKFQTKPSFIFPILSLLPKNIQTRVFMSRERASECTDCEVMGVIVLTGSSFHVFRPCMAMHSDASRGSMQVKVLVTQNTHGSRVVACCFREQHSPGASVF